MRIAVLSSFAFAVLTAFSTAISAAPVASAVPPAPVSAQVAPSAQSERLNLNTADAETIQRGLIGVGAAKAQAIVAYRESNGSFTSVEELLEVKGIGKSILDKNREKVTLE